MQINAINVAAPFKKSGRYLKAESISIIEIGIGLLKSVISTIGKKKMNAETITVIEIKIVCKR